MSTAPDLSAVEAARVAEFGAAPTPPEVLREQVARAMWDVDQPTICGDDNCCTWQSIDDWRRATYLLLADAALAVFQGQQDPAVQRVLELASELDAEESDPDVPTSAERRAGWHAALAVVRTAIGGDGR